MSVLRFGELDRRTERKGERGVDVEAAVVVICPASLPPSCAAPDAAADGDEAPDAAAVVAADVGAGSGGGVAAAIAVDRPHRHQNS